MWALKDSSDSESSFSTSIANLACVCFVNFKDRYALPFCLVFNEGDEFVIRETVEFSIVFSTSMVSSYSLQFPYDDYGVVFHGFSNDSLADFVQFMVNYAFLMVSNFFDGSSVRKFPSQMEIVSPNIS